MHARTLRFFAAILVAACSGSELTEPPRPLAGTNPLSAIQDGNSGGNQDFFFLPPMVDDPSGNSLFLDHGFNASLAPTVMITSGAYSFTATAALNVDHYQSNWQVPSSSTTKTYRVSVKLGNTELGYADVLAAANSNDLKTADGDVVALRDGRTLPIRFIIENFALCGTTGQPTCASETIDLAEGGTVTIPQGGVEIPPQGGSSDPVTVTVSTCPPIPNDLPHYGSCLRVLANPPLSSPLTIPAEVWVCDANLGTLTAQEQRITMHRYDPPDTKALPHAHDQCAPVITDAGGSLRGVVAALFSGEFRAAGRQVRAMIGPRPLYATAMLDVGAGGETDGFSDFQLELSASMTKCGGDGQTVTPGATVNAKVCVTDVGGQAVAGATVNFATSTGSLSASSAVTDVNGEATVVWTIAAGANSLVASGNGIGGVDPNNGPRAGIDPFQPLSTAAAIGDATNGGAVAVLTGSQTFTATGAVADPLPINYGSAGWSYQIDGSPPADWFSSAVSPFATSAPAPFGSANAGCALNSAGLATAWPPAASTFLYARRTFNLASASQVRIGVAIDNDVQVFLDGVDISGTNSQAVVPTGGLLLHEGCPTQDSFTFFTSTLSAGPHIIAIRAKDRGISSYFDASVSIFVPIG